MQCVLVVRGFVALRWGRPADAERYVPRGLLLRPTDLELQEPPPVTKTRTKYWLVLTGAVAGVVLVCAGLWLAALSHPGRFSLDVTADRQIYLLVASGFACTIAGIGLLLAAVRHTTTSMPPQQKTKANIGVGIGFVLQLAGLFLCMAGDQRALSGLLLIFASVPMMIWGCLNYAEGKGHSKWIGLVGIAGILGLIVLMVLPDKHEEAT